MAHSRRPIVFTAAQQQAIADRWAAGESGPAIGVDYGCSRKTIVRVVQRLGTYVEHRPGPQSRYSEEEIADMVRRYRAGESLREVARHFDDCGPANVRELLLSRGVQFRATGRNQWSAMPGE